MFRTVAEINLNNLAYNYLRIRERVPSNIYIMPIVKADAYGHGLIEVSKKLDSLGADLFGVATVTEGETLRKSGIKKPILILGGILKEDISRIIENDLIPMIYSLSIARKYSMALNRNKKGFIHVKIDTGMTRLGILPEEVKEFFTELKRLPNIVVQGVCSHLSSAEEEDITFTKEQIDKYIKSIEIIKKLGFSPLYYHIANSAGFLNIDEIVGNLIRPGLILYGAYPAENLKNKIDLKPVMSFKTRILQIKEVPEKRAVSYGRTFITKRKSRLAVIAVGYADGYSRALSNKGEVLIKGKRAPIVGRVCMDLTIIDITNIADVKEEDEVVLIGEGLNGNIITVDEVAEKIGTISYEVFCNISKRVKRVYIDSSNSGEIIK